MSIGVDPGMGSKFQVNQQVCTVDADGEPFRLVTVTSVGKRKMKLSDGSEWDAEGWRPYGAKDHYYRGPSVREARPDDDERIRQRNLARWISKVPWDQMPLEVLREIHKTVRPIMIEKGLIKPAAPEKEQG